MDPTHQQNLVLLKSLWLFCVIIDKLGEEILMGRNAGKPVFGVSDKASFKPVSSATETS